MSALAANKGVYPNRSDNFKQSCRQLLRREQIEVEYQSSVPRVGAEGLPRMSSPPHHKQIYSLAASTASALHGTGAFFSKSMGIISMYYPAGYSKARSPVKRSSHQSILTWYKLSDRS